MYINKVTLMGNLTRDPETKALDSGIKIASFSIATNRQWKDKDGNRKEAVEYHNLVAFGKTAELIAQYITKGASIYVEGRLQTRSWDKDGEKRYRTEIVVDSFQFGPRSASNGKNGESTDSRKKSSSTHENAPNRPMPDPIEYPDEDINPEDIPF